MIVGSIQSLMKHHGSLVHAPLALPYATPPSRLPFYPPGNPLHSHCHSVLEHPHWPPQYLQRPPRLLPLPPSHCTKTDVPPPTPNSFPQYSAFLHLLDFAKSRSAVSHFPYSIFAHCRIPTALIFAAGISHSHASPVLDFGEEEIHVFCMRFRILAVVTFALCCAKRAIRREQRIARFRVLTVVTFPLQNAQFAF